ncbi:hypothetical protein [Rufibacter roseus]|uniref:Uncharacterized protein n=1 Tax=Rufibacter roseus TaxID=1567108 RepID=A0ABW2DNZ0_9BACT|nr:hypothetical protein [Rufibacter roseus]
MDEMTKKYYYLVRKIMYAFDEGEAERYHYQLIKYLEENPGAIKINCAQCGEKFPADADAKVACSEKCHNAYYGYED